MGDVSRQQNTVQKKGACVKAHTQYVIIQHENPATSLTASRFQSKVHYWWISPCEWWIKVNAKKKPGKKFTYGTDNQWEVGIWVMKKLQVQQAHKNRSNCRIHQLLQKSRRMAQLVNTFVCHPWHGPHDGLHSNCDGLQCVTSPGSGPVAYEEALAKYICTSLWKQFKKASQD